MHDMRSSEGSDTRKDNAWHEKTGKYSARQSKAEKRTIEQDKTEKADVDGQSSARQSRQEAVKAHRRVS